MDQVKLLRHVADNLEAGRDVGHGLVRVLFGYQNPDKESLYLWNPELYEIAPRTRIINEVEVPAPMDKEPDIGSSYWCEAPATSSCSFCTIWAGDLTDKMRFDRGMCYNSSSAAAVNCKARYGIVD